MTTLVCIATGQPLANLIPILQFKPERVVIIASKSFKNKSKEFKTLLHDLGETTQVYTVDGCPNTGIAEIIHFLQDKLLNQLPAERCMVNLTGGTKLHSFALYEVLKSRQDHLFYIDTAHRLIEYYPTAGYPSRHEVLSSVLNIDLSLKGMGKSYIGAESDKAEWQIQVQARKALTFWMAEHIEALEKLLGELNSIALYYDGGKKNQLSPTHQPLFSYPQQKGIELLEKAHDLNLIRWSGKKDVRFDHYQQSRYLTGGWIEEYVWLIAQSLGFEEVKSSVSFGNTGNASEKNRAKNEIDLLIYHQNAMLAVECKSATSAKNVDKSQNMFHKLTGVASRAGGLMCSKLFLSAFSLKEKNGQRDIASLYHAKEQGINIIQSKELLNLSQKLTQWRDTGRL